MSLRHYLEMGGIYFMKKIFQMQRDLEPESDVIGFVTAHYISW